MKEVDVNNILNTSTNRNNRSTVLFMPIHACCSSCSVNEKNLFKHEHLLSHNTINIIDITLCCYILY